TVFMFTGQGSLYPNCCKDLYSESIVFREAFDTCADILNNLTSVDFKGLLFNGVESDNNELIQTRIAQPMLFALEYSLSKLWESAGITPSAMIGHSIGEYVAATISGVFSLEDALYLVSKRGTFMQLQPAGAMISVNYPIGKLYQLLPQSVQIATINTPELAVVSGPHTSINEFCSNLSSLNISFRNVNTSHAFHSEMMEGAVAPFISILKSINLGIPKIPYISNVTGNWVNDKDLSDFQYWATHLRNTVNFSEGIHRLLEDQYYTFIEIGPGNTLCSFVKRCHTYYVKHEMFDKECSITSVSSVRSEHQTDNDYAFYLKALGSLWMRGFDIDMNCFYKGEKRYRVPMPTYSFDRKYHWIEPTQKINTGIGLPLLNVPVTSIHSDANESSEHKQQNHKPEAQNSIENTVHKIWVDLLGLDHIGSEQNFYEIGGDSIWASQIISRINDAFAISMPLSAFLKTPTISGLTTEIQQRFKESSQAVKHSGISITDNNSPVPLTVSQQRLWFLNLLTPESPANNLSTQFSIKGRFDIKAAHDAIKHIVRKHDSLRMVIEETSSNPVLIVKESVIFDFDVVDISHEVNKISRLKQEVLSRSLKPYDLTKGPLLRILLVSLDPYNHFLYVMTHHIISDGWSMGIFLKDFAYFYKLIITNSPIPNQTVEMTFSEYAKLVANQNHSDSVEHIQYWTRTLSLPLPVTELPSDNIRPPHRSFKGGGTSFSIDSQICTNLEIYAKKEHVTIFVLFLTAYYILLSKYSGQKDIIIGTPVANRN
ncbi:MAG: acyltransferase domain-containing protein, partial [Fibrobacter sp.]|nr:acyltransferase domain-containing protein [Fibrobacter sp.]